MNIGICGTGTVASWISSILNQLGDEKIRLYACATAPGFDCTEFAEKFGIEKVYPTYEDLMRDPKVDLVYIAVPNTYHYELIKQALELGKAVLCEKPFAINDTQCKQLIDLAKEKDLFLCEALWPAFLPVRKAIDDEIAAGTIGEITGGNLIMMDNVMFLDRVRNMELGGGNILDNGAYTLGRMVYHFGIDIKSMTAEVRKLDTGVDAEEKITVEYADGRKVFIHQAMDTPQEEHQEYGEILGTKGKIWFDSVANPRQCKVLDNDGNLVREIPIPPQIKNQGMPPVSGYEYEFIACEKALREGKTECEEATLAQTLAIAQMMTEVRRQAGIIFPFE